MNWEGKGHHGYDYNNNYFYNPQPHPSQFLMPPTPIYAPADQNQNYNNYCYGTYCHQDQFSVYNQFHQPQRQVSNYFGSSSSTVNKIPPYSVLSFQDHTHSQTRPIHQESQTFDAQEEFREKLIAYARFNRNDELMKTVVSEVVIPEINGIVTSTRVKALTNQVDALSNHEKKVSKEILEIQEEFKCKKRKFEDSCDDFWKNYKKLCEPPVTTEVYTQMVNKYYDELKHNLELIRWQKTLAWAHETVAATTNTSVTLAKSNKPLLAEILAAPTQCYHPQVSTNHHSGGELTTTATRKNL